MDDIRTLSADADYSLFEAPMTDDDATTGAAATGEPAQPDATNASTDSDAEPRPEQVLEALLFSSDTPLSAAKLADLCGDCTPAGVRRHLEQLNERYEQAGLSFRVELIAGGYQMMTLPQFRPHVARLHKQRSETRLSDAALETLSIIAYRQPIIRADVEAIRGVACGEVINRLRELGLVRIIGRAEVVGRPMLYGTTRKFLQVFGLADLDDLPPMEALQVKPAREQVVAQPTALRAAAGA